MARNVAYLTAAGRLNPRMSIERAEMRDATFTSSLRLSLSNRTALELPIGEVIGDFTPDRFHPGSSPV